MPVPEYVRSMRSRVGHDLLVLNGATGIVHDERGRILLLRRADNGRWSLPGGIIDPGEQPADAVLREIAEETGVVARIDRLAGVASHPSVYPNGDVCEYLAVWFRCSVVSGVARADGDESLEVGWFAAAQLPALGAFAMLRIETAAAVDGAPWFAPAGADLSAWFPRDTL